MNRHREESQPCAFCGDPSEYVVKKGGQWIPACTDCYREIAFGEIPAGTVHLCGGRSSPVYHNEHAYHGECRPGGPA